MAIFYHVSTNLKHNGCFKPRIPSCRHKEKEDDKVCRVSVAPTIEDCLTAIPNGGSDLDQLNIDQRGYFLIFRIDTDKIDISSENIVSSETLFKEELVRDADVTNEYWITTSFTVPEEDRFLIHLIDWDEEVRDIIPYWIYELADKKYEGNYLEAYQEVYNSYIPSSIIIKNSTYIHEKGVKGQEISLYFDNDEEKEAILFFIKEHNIGNIKDVSIDELLFELNRDTNLRNLFLFHANVAMITM